jgi:hypothetical protein
MGRGFPRCPCVRARAEFSAAVEVVIAVHAFVQNPRRAHYDLGVDARPAPRVAAAFTELAEAI